jgi:hypothetical protein
MRVSKGTALERSVKSSSVRAMPPGRSHRDKVDDVVGRAPRREQGDDAVYEGALVENRCDQRVVVAKGGERQGALRSGGGERVAQGGIRLNADRGTISVTIPIGPRHLTASAASRPNLSIASGF